MEGFVDYFQLLCVEHTAEQADIDAHYKNLCKQFHPDINREPDAESRMKEINRAYEILGDEVKRGVYRREWLRRRPRPAAGTVSAPVQRTAGAPASPKVPPKTAPKAAPKAPAHDVPKAAEQAIPRSSAAHGVMSAYFSALSGGRYRQAYDLLSDADKHSVAYASFEEWQRSVGEIYSISNFRIRCDQRYDAYMLDDRTTCMAERFVIEITEENRLDGKVSRYDFRKFAIQERGQWRVFLGYRDLSYISEQFRYIANTREEAAILGQWNSYRDTTNLNLGLPNRKGFIERAKPEMYRKKRYKRPLTLAVLRVNVLKQLGDGLRGRMEAYAGHTLKRMLRTIDILGVLEDGIYCLMLVEANARTANKVLKRLSQRVETETYRCFDIRISIEYNTDPCNEDIASSLDACRARL